MRQPRNVGFKRTAWLAACLVGILGVAIAGLVAMLGVATAPATVAAQGNPIVVENQQAGTNAWDLLNQNVQIATDSIGQIKGYASATSVNKGGNITFRISVNTPQTYTIDVYRIGWYGGLGGRLMQHVGPLNGTSQPTCPVNATTGLIECNWADAYTLTTQTTWTSGIYVAVLKNAANFYNFIEFAVRDDARVAPLVYQQPVTTYQAYNAWPNNNTTGKSLYDFNSFGPLTVGGSHAAVKVSFDRPYMDNGSGGDFFQWEINFIRWMERSGYDVTYTTSVDTHTNGGRLLNFRGFISSGHDEYWSKTMYDAAIAARDAGINLAFFGANSVYTQIRFESSATGVPNRVIVCYRDAAIDPNTDPTLETVNWRDPPLNRPEQTLVGVQYISQVGWANGFFGNYKVNNSSHWVYAGTGFADGNTVKGMVGYEADQLFSSYPGPNAVPGTYTLLSTSPYTGGTANSSIYQAPSGAWVFGGGTIDWSWALDSYGNGFNIVDSRIQIATANIFNRFINAQPPPAVTSVTPASGPTTGGTAITISGANFVAGASVTIGGAAATGVTRVNSTTITATTSANAVGTFGVTVINPDGLSGTLANGFTYISTAPTVNSVSPISGPTAGGTPITLSGTNYAAGATVTIGGTAATAVIVVNGTTITAVTPAHAFGSVNAVVQNTDGQSGLKSNAFTYLAPPPTLTSVTPAGGPTTGGTALTLTGTGFISGATVTVGGTPATGVTVVNSTTITATTPAHSSGTVAVSVTNADTQVVTLAGSFTYSSPFQAPTVTGVAPGSGSTNGGTAVTISGTGFLSGATVNIGGTAPTAVTVVNATTITATTVTHAAGAVSVSVTNTDGQSATLANAFTYLAPPGVIFDAVGPAAGGIAVDTGSSLTWNHTVTTTGSNLLLTVGVAVGRQGDTGLSLSVTYNGVAMTSAGLVHSNNDSTGYVQLFYLKAPATGTHAVVVTLSGGTATLEAGSLSFSGVDQTTPVRNITTAAGSGTTPAVTLASGPGNMVVDAMATGCPGTITSNTTLRWLNQLDCSSAGGVGAQSTAAGAASVTMGYTVPSDWWGIIAMDVLAAPSQQASFDFTLSNSGNQTVARGSAVPNTITATLSSGTTQAATFSASGMPSGVTAAFDTPTCAPTCTTTLTLTANAAAALGTSAITATAVAGSVTRPTSFNLTVTAPPPTVTGVSPTSGPIAGGTAITITGTNFLSGATASIGGTPATGVTVVNSTTITATAPAHAVGLVGVSVTNSDSQSATLASAFAYVAPPPTISSVSPISGAAAGGTPLTISGTGFAAGATVTVGGTAATGVTVVNSTTITATTPAHAAGFVSVTVANPDLESATRLNAFTYLGPPPTVSNVAPASGPAAGGSSVTITGTNFATGATVTIGGTAATGVTVVNSTTITATTPAHAAGAVGVTVTNLDTQSATLAIGFTYLGPPPAVTGVSPISGSISGGTAVTITGTGFAAGATVTIGGNTATGVTVVNSTSITATTPAHTAGAVGVTVTNADSQSGTAANAFTYVASAPSVATVAPVSGSIAGGTAVTITGTNFAAGAAVTIGGVSATGISVVNATTITATTPAHAAGAVNVTVTNPDTQSATLTNGFTYLAPAPVVTTVAPTSGSTGGGTAITISGTNFLAGASVTVGGTAATTVTVVNSSTITATTPAHAGGAVGVTVTNPDTQSATLASSFTFVVPPPTVTGVSPASGSTTGGTAVTITGTGFAAGATVTIGGNPATGVTVVNSTSITATTPAHAAGAVGVTVTNADSQSGTAATAFTYVAPAPTVASVAPASGSIDGATGITITGTNFAAGAAVTIGGVPATGISVVNATTITAATPAHAAGAVNVTVTNPDTQSATLTNGFTYLAPAPVVTAVAPTSGSTGGGTAITISGTNFLAGATVTVGGTAATAVTVVNSSTITATTPAHASGAVGVTVTNPDTQSATLASSFTYLVPPPTVTGVSPAFGPIDGGTAVTITGTGFAAGATVTIGGDPATGVTVVNSTSITATTPAHAAGPVGVTVTNVDSQSDTAGNAFTYVAPAPTVTSVAPASGSIDGATGITITGTNFEAGAAVTIGGVPATGISVVNATTITATTPAHAAGAVNVTVTNPDTQSATRTNGFTYLAPAPVVTTVAPTSGSTGGGTAITISGSNFLAGATVTVGGTAATAVTVVNSSTITATTPAHAGGAVGVTVTNPDTQSATLASSFTFVVPPPTVTGVSPASGSTNGGTAVTITGTGFAAGATVTIGGTAATGVTVVNSTSITATTPAHAAGTVGVTVTNTDSQSGTAANAFTYVAPAPTVASVAPASGSIAGGTAVTITGTNFVAGAAVTIGGVPATGISVVNATTITAATPAHAAGAVNVTVTNPDTQSGTRNNGFTYLGPPPVVTSVAPTSGSTSGGTAITISGGNFLAGATVTVGGTAATGVTVVNSTTITATTAAHAAGAVDVIVANADGQSGTLAGAYTYVASASAVAFDSVAPGATGASVANAATLSWNHTVTATGSDRLLTVGVTVGKSNDAGLVVTVKYAGVPMTSAGIVHSNNRTAGFVQLFYLVAPATGTNQVLVTMTGGTGSIEAGSVSFTGVNQTTPIRNITTAFGTSNAPRVTVASAPGNMVVDALASGCNGTITSTQTLRWVKPLNCSTGAGNGAQATAQGAASVVMGYTVPSDWWGIVAMDLIAKQ